MIGWRRPIPLPLAATTVPSGVRWPSTRPSGPSTLMGLGVGVRVRVRGQGQGSGSGSGSGSRSGLGMGPPVHEHLRDATGDLGRLRVRRYREIWGTQFMSISVTPLLPKASHAMPPEVRVRVRVR